MECEAYFEALDECWKDDPAKDQMIASAKKTMEKFGLTAEACKASNDALAKSPMCGKK